MLVRSGIYKIGCLLMVEDAELIVEAIRALNEKLENEKCITPDRKRELVDILLQFEIEIAHIKDVPEQLQNRFQH